MKKKILTTLSVVLILGMAVLGIMAWLTSEDSNVNVMTAGNVKIDQQEYERVTDENGNFVIVDTSNVDPNYGYNQAYELQPFTQAKPAYPAVYQEGEVVWDDFQQLWNQVGAPGSNDIFDDSVKNVIDKFVFVKNTGKFDAYYRTIVAIEAPEGITSGTVHSNFNANTRFTQTKLGYVEINDVRYVVYEMLYNEILTPGEVSRPSLLQVYLDPKATNEDCALFGETWDILTISQAVQTKGFANANEALDTAFGNIDVDNVAALFEDMKIPTVVTEDEALAEALGSGEDVVVPKDVDIVSVPGGMDAAGATVELNGEGAGAYGYLAFIPEAGQNADVSNLNVTGSGFVEVGHWGIGGGTYTVNNVKIENLASTLANADKGFTLACAFCHYGNATLNDCVMTGATAVQAGAIPVDAGFVNDTTTVVNGGEYGTIYCWSHAKVTIDGAKVDTLYVSPIKGTVTIKAGTHVETINVDYGTSTPNINKDRLSKLNIEDGAVVDTIVHNGNSYTVAQWNSYVAGF